MNVTAVQLEGFDIEVRLGAPEARAVADIFLGGAWRVEAGIANPRQYDVWAPNGTSMDIGEAWEMARKMIEDPRVVRAEPILSIATDVVWNWAATRRLIESEVAGGATLITIERGGPNDGVSLLQAVRQAAAKGIVVASTARDRWPFAVYPAKYPEVVSFESKETAAEQLARDRVAVQKSRLAEFAEYFPDTDPAQVYAALLQLLNTSEMQLEADLEQFGNELKLHVALDTDVRARIAGSPEPGKMLPLSRSLRAKMMPALVPAAP
jgi:hypothetical protein